MQLLCQSISPGYYFSAIDGFSPGMQKCKVSNAITDFFAGGSSERSASAAAL